MANTHDPAYVQLYAHPQMVEDLLRGYVHEDWVAEVDFATLERMPDSFVSDSLRDRADDIIWRVRWGKRWLYLYLLIEFQSKVDDLMAVRMLTYVGLLYQDLKRTGRLDPGAPLPPVLPIVLYNGDAPWNASDNLEALAETNLPPSLARFQPQLRYLLLDEGRIAEHPDPELRNLCAALFQLEFSPDPDNFRALWDRLFDWLQRPEQDSLRRAFIAWANRIGLRRHFPDVTIGELYDAQEISKMLANPHTDWTQKWKQEGRQEGHQEGESALLLRQLKRRFGPQLPGWVGARIQAASIEQLEAGARPLWTPMP